MKKLLFKSLCCLTFALYGTSADAQSVNTQNTSSPTACDGYAYFFDTISYSTWNWMQGSTVLQTGDIYFTGLCAGNYTLALSDTMVNFTIGSDTLDTIPVNPCNGFNGFITNVQNATAIGICDGSMSASVVGGTAPFSYSWSNGATTSAIDSICGNTFAGVTIIDANGCIATDSAAVYFDSINNPCNGYHVYIPMPQNTSAANVCDGEMSAFVLNGTAPYTYSWSNGETTADIDSLCRYVTYSVTVTDANGCTGSDFSVIDFDSIPNSPCDGFSAFISFIQNPSSASVCDGSVAVSVSGGIAPYTYSWSNGATSNAIDSLCANVIYQVTITDSMGCVFVMDSVMLYSDSIVNPSPCNGFVYVDFTMSAETFPGACDGSVTAVPVGGTAPYTYSWNTGSTTATADLLCGNTYLTVLVIDSAGCGINNGLLFNSDSLNPICNGFSAYFSNYEHVSPGACDGSLTVALNGGTAPFHYSWSTGATTSTVNGLCEGNYFVSVTDSFGCVATASAYIYTDTSFVDSSLVIYTSPTGTSADGVCDGTLTVTAWGGVAPYWFSLSGGAWNSTGYFDSLCQGIYGVTVVDAYGDTVYVDVIISNPGNTYNNPAYGDSVYIDSIMSDLQTNCQINYQSIDSVYIIDYTIAGDSVFVNWNVVTGSGNILITQVYYLGSGYGVYSLGLQVYCPGKALGNYFTARDQIYFGGALGVKENTMGEISLYPNPMADQLNIDFTEVGNYTAILFDLSGREMMQVISKDSSKMILNVSELARGQYVLKIAGNNGLVTKSVVK